MRPLVKVCCIADEREAELAIERGAAAVGLVSSMPSGPGVIDEAMIARVAAAVTGRAETFLLTSLTRVAAIAEQHQRCGTSTVQLVDEITDGTHARLRALLPGVRLVQVIHVVGEQSLVAARALAPHVDALLLDSGNPALVTKQLGGTGRVHDWSLSRRIVDDSPVPVWLAGGLDPDNVVAAIHAVQPHGLDVCSGLRTDGRLDAGKLDAFMSAVKGSATSACAGASSAQESS